MTTTTTCRTILAYVVSHTSIGAKMQRCTSTLNSFATIITASGMARKDSIKAVMRAALPLCPLHKLLFKVHCAETRSGLRATSGGHQQCTLAT